MDSLCRRVEPPSPTAALADGPLADASFPGTDVISVIDRPHRNIAVTGLARAGRTNDRLHDLVNVVVMYDDGDLGLHGIPQRENGAAPDVGRVFILRAAAYLPSGHVVNAQAVQRFFHVFHFVRANHTSDELTRP